MTSEGAGTGRPVLRIEHLVEAQDVQLRDDAGGSAADVEKGDV
jgi:hypothetical protein